MATDDLLTTEVIDDLDFSAEGTFPFLADADESEEEKDAFEKDDVLAQTMAELSLGERTKIEHDIYGIHEVVEETPDFVLDKLTKFDIAINSITNKASYDAAFRQSSEYVRNLRLMFLRSREFDAVRAAARMVGYFQKKEQLFGVDKLAKDIKLSDLNEDDIRALESGFIQVLPSRDRAGRLITLLASTMGKGFAMENLVRG